jgi:hypothetical protein
MAWQYNIWELPLENPLSNSNLRFSPSPRSSQMRTGFEKRYPSSIYVLPSRAFRGRASAAIVYSPQYHRARVGFIFSFLVNDDRFIPRRILQVFAVGVKGCEPHSE